MIEKSPVYLTLLLMNNLRTLTLMDCPDFPFVLALDPKLNPSGTVLCPKLEELILYVTYNNVFHVSGLLEMVKQRASNSTKLSTVTIVSPPAKEVLKLRDHVSRVEYRLDDVTPEWSVIPTDTNATGYKSDW